LTPAVVAALFVVCAFAQPIRVPQKFAVYFETNPLSSSDIVLDGGALERLTWNDDAPAFPSDHPGSLTALYDSRLAGGRIGWPLPQRLTEGAPFRATAVFVIEPDGFHADPFGFFQISWGLWNSRTTGLERTGSFTDFASDTFELVEFVYFPNVSPFFGGPFLSPTLFGVANPDDPSFDFLGGFVNLAFGSVPAALPLGEPLRATISHRPGDDAAVVTVERINEAGRHVPIPGAVAIVPLGSLAVREYAVDTIGLTLWHDGFGGDPPSLRAEVVFHEISVAPIAVAID
jgi:hypothetical protein